MSDYRIVFNEQTECYRVERRGWLGWSFVMNAAGDDYVSFSRYADARRFVCRATRHRRYGGQRRWKVVDLCSRPCN